MNRDNDIVVGCLLFVLRFPAGLALLACGGFLLDLFSVSAIPGGRLRNGSELDCVPVSWILIRPRTIQLLVRSAGAAPNATSSSALIATAKDTIMRWCTAA